jgi:3-deoxy-D-manno-octulosonate 8-phosphate phosphatase (KDO 8-P phosphatase)
MKKYESRIKGIKMLLLDVDGVMTDGGIILGPGKMELKKFHVHDGMGITLARAAGLRIGFLTGRASEAVRKRARELGIEDVQQGANPKEKGYLAILRKHHLRDEQVTYMGDDLPDVPILKRVGFAVCVANGTDEAKRVAHYITRRKGGEGAVREVVEMLLDGLGKKEDGKESA